jgi:glycosyltransferase involved in cell wall biosynthesis
MKILFLANRVEGAGSRYRFLQYIPYLEKQGWSVEARTIPRRFPERMRLFASLGSFDVVFLHRRLFSLIEWHVFRRAAGKVVFDFDDAVMFRDSKRGRPGSVLRRLKFKRTVRESDRVVAGNAYLEGMALSYNRNVTVIPTSIDMDRYVPKAGADNDGTVTLGWIGSASTAFYLEQIRGVLDKIYMRHPNTRLKIVSDRFCDLDAMPVEKKMWSREEEIADLHSFDIGLMPLTDDPWSRGKCGFKLLQYMAVGVPPVCSPVGVNREIVTHGVNGFHAMSESEWLESLGNLIRESGLRRRLGGEARRTVEERYSLDVNAPRLAAAISGTDKVQ